MKKILIASDTASNHYGGVNLRMIDLVEQLRKKNFSVFFLNADIFYGFYVPFIKAIKIPLVKYGTIKKIIEKFMPDYVHIETEGPIGTCVKKFCLNNQLNFTTAYSTRYDHHLYDRIKFPKYITNKLIYLFHKHSSRILVRSQSIHNWLSEMGLPQSMVLDVGVRKEFFYCEQVDKESNKRKPVCIYVGRVEKEKNLEDFLSLTMDIEKIVGGSGGLLNQLKRKYTEVNFVGYVEQEKLRHWYSLADVFVFPSKSETLGNVLMEAMACGLPVAAYPVCGPIDVVEHGVSGWLGHDLKSSIQMCCTLSRKGVVDYAKRFIANDIADNFFQALLPAKKG